MLAQYAPLDGPFANALPLVPSANIALGISITIGNTALVTAYGGNVFAPSDVGRLVRIQSQVYNTPPWQVQFAATAGMRVSNNGNNYIALTSGTTGGSAPVHTQGAVYDGQGNVANIGAVGVLWQYTDSGYGIGQITVYTSPTQVTVNVLVAFPFNVVTLTSSITGISNSAPAVVTTANALVLGQPCFITGAGGMTQINGNIYTVVAASGTAVTLAGIYSNSSAYPAYTSGGQLIGNASIEWQLGAWSNTTEWPRACAIFKDRLFWGGKVNAWGSVPGLYTSHAQDFNGQVTTDAAVNILVQDGETGPILWMQPAITLLVGTSSGEFAIDAANFSTAPMGPGNIECLRQSRWRCRPIAPELIGVSILYAQRSGRKIFAMDYTLWLNRYDSTDQQKYAYHISIGGLSGIAYQAEPWSILWSWRSDGTFLSYTFNREDQVTAWCRHNMGGGGIVESMQVTPSPSGLYDEVWFIVNRAINGQTVRTVEYMTKHYEGPQAGYAGDAQSSAWYVDCGVQSVAPGTTQLTGLPPVMYGQSVSVLADGGSVGPLTVSSTGTLALPGTFTTVTVGFGYQCNLVPMRVEGGADVGTSQGKIKNGAHLVLRLVDTYGATVAQLSNLVNGVYTNPLGQLTQNPPAQEWAQLNYTTTGLNSPPPLQSGDFPVSFPSVNGSDQDATDFYMLISQNLPLPMTVAGLFPSFKTEERQ